MNTGFSKREVNLNNCNNHELARIFNSLLDVIKKKKGRHQSQVAKDTGVTNIGRYKHSGGKLHYYNAKGSEKLRVNVIEKICNHYGFDIDSIEVLGESEDARYFFQLNEDFKNQEYSFYVCYYWGHAQKITTALMEIRNDWHNASMLFFEDDMGSTRSELTGTIKTLGANLFLILQDTQDKYYALISLFIGGTIAKKRKFLTGTYSSASTSSNAPTAGKIILEKYENKQTAILKAKQKEIHPVIFSELFLQRIESIERSVTVAKTLSDFPTFNTVSKLKNYAGVYKGQYLYSSKKPLIHLSCKSIQMGKFDLKELTNRLVKG